MDSMSLAPRPLHLPRTSMPADATRVALPSVRPTDSRLPGVGIKMSDLPAHHDTYIGPADPHAPSAAEAKARFRAQESVDAACSLDPFAAEVNGMRNFGTQARPHWQRVGASPLEYAASMAHPTAFGLVNTVKGVAEAVHEPSAVNIATAALGAGSLMLGSLTHVSGLPHGVHAVAEGAERVHQGLNFIEAGGGLDNVKASLHGESHERLK